VSDTIYTYVADHELAALLKAAAEAGKRVRVVAEGETFEIEINPKTKSRDAVEGYDPAATREAWESIAGILPDIDAEAWIRQIKEDREQDTPSRKFP
jgi:hypothetical protein